MPVSDLVITPAAANANAYCDVAFADQYHLDRPAVGTTWATASADSKAQAILWATKLLDDLWCWEGWVTTATQSLLWPRQGALNRNRQTYVDSMTIPVELQRACAEYARQLLVDDLAGNNDIETLGITSIKAGPVAVTFQDTVFAKPVPDTVVYLIPAWWGRVLSRDKGYLNLVRA